MRKVFITIVMLLMIVLTSCISENSFILKDSEYSYPSKERPKDLLVQPITLEGEKLELVDFFAEPNDLISNQSGIITTSEKYESLNLQTKLSPSLFNDHFIIYKTGYSMANYPHNKFINASIHNNRINLLLEYSNNKNEPKIPKLFFYTFKKVDEVHENMGVTFLGYEVHYKSPASYLYIYFDNKENMNMKNMGKHFLNTYNLDNHFYLEGSQDYSNSIKLRVSDGLVSLKEVEKVLKNALSDNLVLYYTLYNDYYNHYENVLNDKNVFISRDGYNGFSSDDNISIVSSFEEFDNLINDYLENEINPNHSSDYINGLKQTYNSDFFKNFNLILFGITEASGSIDLYFPELILEDNKALINLYRLIPDTGTDDMAYYTAYIKVPKKINEAILKVKIINLYSNMVESN